MNYEEQAHQQAFVQWLEITYPSLRPLLNICSIGENVGSRRMGQLKTMGLTPGWPDLLLAVGAQGSHGLFIEMKAPKGRLSKDQKQIHNLLKMQGYQVSTCYGWEEAKYVINAYLS